MDLIDYRIFDYIHDLLRMIDYKNNCISTLKKKDICLINHIKDKQ